MEINLLPKRPPLEEYRFSVIVLPLLLVVALGAFGLVRFLQIEAETAFIRSELTQTLSENAVMRAQRTLDSKTKLFNQIQSAVKEVQANERDYGTMLDGIAAKLPSKARVTSASMDADKQTVTLILQFDSIDNIADYAVLLRDEPWVKEVFIEDIQNAATAGNDQVNQNAGQNLQANGNLSDTLKKQFPFSTKVVITLASNGVPGTQTDDNSKK